MQEAADRTEMALGEPSRRGFKPNDHHLSEGWRIIIMLENTVRFDTQEAFELEHKSVSAYFRGVFLGNWHVNEQKRASKTQW